MLIIYIILGVTVWVSRAAWLDPELADLLAGHPYSVHYAEEWHRLLTSGLVHADMMHLVFNMLTFYSFARPVMQHLWWTGWWGGMREVVFLMLYVGGMLSAHGVMYYLHGDDPLYYHVGASAGVVAVMAGAVVCEPTGRIAGIPAIMFLPLYLLVSFALKDTPTNIGHLAHFVGGVFGFVWMVCVRYVGG